MDLFGRQGYRATTIAQIEEAAGLSPGAGGLYRHFATKRQLVEAGLTRQIEAGPQLQDFLDPARVPESGAAQLVAIARAGLRRLDHERDLNRLLMRDLAAFPDLLRLVRDRELRAVHAALTRWLTVTARDDGIDTAALAAVLMAAVSHFWIMRDIFGGEHPLEISEQRFLETLAGLADAAVNRALE
jgi:AcrR family transcriptional regulator